MNQHNSKKLQNPMKFLASLINYERVVSPYYDFKLDKFRKFLNSIGNPQEKLSNVILIAGTKGKGSTAIFIESVLRECGIKTGLYTSPHILSLRERIKVNNKNISQRNLDRLVNQIQTQAKKYNITFFEAVTAVAFLYFLERKVDYTILEVGLGGRLDATNVSKPIVSVITKIGYDHIEVLGKTLKKIAKEKAGIIHPSAYIVLSPQKPSVLQVIKEKTKATKICCYDTSRELRVKGIKTNLTGSNFTVEDKNGLIGKFKINTAGVHQIENACTALAVLKYLQKQDARITNKGVLKGLANAQIQARCQVYKKNPLIIVDGAHNPDSAKALYDLLKNIIKKKAIVIFGSSQGKLVKEMFRILLPITKTFILTQSKNPRHIPSVELASIIKKFSVPYLITNNITTAIKQGLLKQKVRRKSPLVITGSFYVASEALVALKKLK